MKFTYDWLKDYLDTTATPAEIADALTRTGLEVEDLIIPQPPVAAKIVECEKHPDSDHLHILKVDDGGDELRTVVCGAPNARAGIVSALARPGCKIGDMEIKSGKVRGVMSDGMMCSGRELGINDNHDGIIELDAAAEKIGAPISGIKSLVIFDAGITPNRPDYLAVRGIARDLAAAGVGTLTIKSEKNTIENTGARKVIVENQTACPTYRLAEIHKIKMAQSDPIIAARLSAIGINPKNAPIDTTNYICYDMAQPMHCFDADEIQGDIIVRNARAGEKFTDLFGDTHELVDTDLVITDGAGILALAGVVGGARGMTTDKTKNILLECAYFDPVTVRRTSKRIGVSTDSSYRYERGIDPTSTADALLAAVQIIQKQCGGEIVGINSVATEYRPHHLNYNPDLFGKKTGVSLDSASQLKILNDLGYVVDAGKGDTWDLIVPSRRVDVTIPEAVVADLIRMYGYDNIKQNKTIKKIDFNTQVPSIKQHLVARGFYECLTYGFGDSKKEALLSDMPSVQILNPIIDTFDTARNSLVQSMLDVIADNDRFRRSNLSLFELAAVFDGAQPGQQHDQLVIARTGIAGDKIGIKHGREVSIYDVRDDLMSLFPNAVAENDKNPPRWANPYRAGKLVMGDKTVAIFAELHPAVAKKFAIKTNVVIGLVDDVAGMTTAVKWLGNKTPTGQKIALAEFPLITRDFAFVAPGSVAPDELVKIAKAADSRIIEANVFDIFEMPDGNKSIAFEIVLQPVDNITDEQLTQIHSAIIAHVEKNCPAKLRA